MTTAELAAAMRVAYDPASSNGMDETGTGVAEIAWADCAHRSRGNLGRLPARLRPVRDLGHVGGAPRCVVFANVLERLVAPHKDIDRKRVTILYRPHDPAAATKAVDRDDLDAIFKEHGRKVDNARDTLAVRAAQQAAAEEATGAGVVRFAVLITATVLHPNGLPAAAAAVESLAVTSRMTVRRMYGSQVRRSPPRSPSAWSCPPIYECRRRSGRRCEPQPDHQGEGPEEPAATVRRPSGRGRPAKVAVRSATSKRPPSGGPRPPNRAGCGRSWPVPAPRWSEFPSGTPPAIRRCAPTRSTTSSGPV